MQQIPLHGIHRIGYKFGNYLYVSTKGDSKGYVYQFNSKKVIKVVDHPLAFSFLSGEKMNTVIGVAFDTYNPTIPRRLVKKNAETLENIFVVELEDSRTECLLNDIAILLKRQGCKKIDLDSGKPLWDVSHVDYMVEHNYPPDKLDPIGKVFCYNGVIIFNLKANILVALDLATGQLRWSQPNVCDRYLAVFDTGEILTTVGQEILFLDALSGEVTRRLPMQGSHVPESYFLTWIDATTTHVWLGWEARGKGTQVVAVNKESGHIDWEYGFQHPISGTPVILNNRLYVTTVSIDLVNGPQRTEYVFEGVGGYIPD